MAFGVDYTSSSADLSKLKAAGVKFVCRYLAPNTTSYLWKLLKPGEAKDILAAGLGLVTVWETSANRALSGSAAGVSDAQQAQAWLKQCNAPADAVVYFAVDFDAQPSQFATINAYLAGAASVLGKDRVGIYGGLHPVKAALDAGVCKWAWQTYAWSAGQWDARAQLRQYSNGHTLGGVQCDYDHSMALNYGQWGYEPPKWRFELWAQNKRLTASNWAVKAGLAHRYRLFHHRIKARLQSEAVAGHGPKIIRRRKKQ